MSSTATMKSSTSASSLPKSSRKSASLPPETVEYLKAWMMSPEHVAHPYPTEQEKAQIMAETGIELKQLTNWFVNNRKRYWKPRVEAKLQKFTGPSPPAGGDSLPPPHLQQGNNGGLSISIHHMNPTPLQLQATCFPMLPNNEPSGLFSQGSSSGPASHLNHAKNLFGPAAGAIVAAALAREDDPHTISEGSGSSACNSDDDSVSSSGRSSSFGSAAQYLDSGSSTTTGSVPVNGGYRRHEEVDVHVLHPEGSFHDEDAEPLPCLRDLTIKSSVPKDRILATFKCPISYTIPYEIEHDRKKVQSRRDGEVLRVKKHYLKLYLATRGIHSVSSPRFDPDVLSPSSASSVSSATETEVLTLITSASTIHAISPMSNPTVTAPTSPSPSRSRAFTCTDLSKKDESPSSPDPRPRKRARTASGSFLKGDEEWRALCQTAQSLYCESLPSLEEAARMFGYVSP